MRSPVVIIGNLVWKLEENSLKVSEKMLLP